jgi:uncharacterized protein
LILIVLDAGKPVTHKKVIEEELFNFGIRINQRPPEVKFIRKNDGGINVQEMVKQTKGMSIEVARLVCREYKISCAEFILREDITVDQFIDVIEGNRAYVPALYVFNKIDSITIEELDILDRLPNYVPISSQHQWNLEELMEEIWNRTTMLRIYTKPKGQLPDYDEPVILHAENPTIEEFCNRLHKGLIADFSHAWVWGTGVCDVGLILCLRRIVEIAATYRTRLLAASTHPTVSFPPCCRSIGQTRAPTLREGPCSVRRGCGTNMQEGLTFTWSRTTF